MENVFGRISHEHFDDRFGDPGGRVGDPPGLDRLLQIDVGWRRRVARPWSVRGLVGGSDVEPLAGPARIPLCFINREK